MRRLRSWAFRIAGLLPSRRRERELAEEIDCHLQMHTEENLRFGMTLGEARQQALLKLGGLEQTKQSYRERETIPALSHSLQDLHFAGRQLRRNPEFTITAIFTLALGIGAATAVFSVAYGVLIDPFPYYKDAHTLATPKLCWPELGTCGWRGYTPSQLNEIVHKTDIFSAVTASTYSKVVLTGGLEPRYLRASFITPNIFGVLGVQPILGRASTDDDVRPGHEEVALLSYRVWQSYFGGSPSILGRTFNFNGHPRTIIGIMPLRFLWHGEDVYLPVNLLNQAETDGLYFALIGRLKRGVTEAQAATELKPIFNDFYETQPFVFTKNLRLGILPLDEMFRMRLAGTLYLLLGSVFVLLLIACVNVSTLILARAVRREQEFVIRASIGASRLRLARYALTECLLLAIISMPVALAFAYAGLLAILRIVPADTIPDDVVIRMNLPVLFVSIGLALLTVLLFGLAPAWRSANPRLSAAMIRARSSASRMQHRLLRGFVVTEIALSLGLLTLASLLIHSLWAVETEPVPYSPDHTLVAHIPLANERYPTPASRIRFFRDLLDRVHALLGVDAATVDASVPFMDIYPVHVQIDGEPVDTRNTAMHPASPDFLAISHRRMLEGHFLDAREIADGSRDIVVTESFAKRYFHGRDVLGRAIHLPEFRPDGKNRLEDNAFTVVGVMTNLPLFALFRNDYPQIFMPYTVAPEADDTLILSTALPAKELVNSVRRLVSTIDKDQPVTDVATLRQTIEMYGYAEPRFEVALFGSFAAAALLLSFVGIYGVLSFITSQRTHEIGIRMALGADRVKILWMVLRQAGVMALLGVAAGLPPAFFAGTLAQGELIKTPPHDLFSLFAAVCILPLLAVAGTYLPARRAAGINPAESLRAEL